MASSVYISTFYRPWCCAVARFGKRVENRESTPGWPLPWYMAIRSGKTWEGTFEGAPTKEEWPAGRVVAIAEVTKYLVPGEVGDPDQACWRDPSAWGWVLGRVATLKDPVVWPPPEVVASRGRILKGLVRLELDNYVYDAVLHRELREAWRLAFGGGGR